MFIPNERETDLETKLLDLRHMSKRDMNSTCQSDQERLEPTNCFFGIHTFIQCDFFFFFSFFLFFSVLQMEELQ
jgi:heme/copper-type cytochrome/quinol oxidase subunit 3